MKLLLFLLLVLAVAITLGVSWSVYAALFIAGITIAVLWTVLS